VTATQENAENVLAKLHYSGAFVMDASKLIPQLFFDLIARVVPGSLAIIMIAIAANIKLGKLITDFWDGAQAIQESGLFLGLGFFLAAYLIGHLISPIGIWIEEQVIRRLFPTYYRVLQDAVLDGSDYSPSIRNFFMKEMGFKKGMDIRKVPANQYEKMVFVWNDWLQVNNPDVGTRAAKVRAEYRMHSENVVVFFGALVLHLIVTYEHQGYPNFIFIGAVAIAGLVSLWATARMYRTFQWAVIQNFYSVKTPRGQATSD
jgi:hypothetical protein